MNAIDERAETRQVLEAIRARGGLVLRIFKGDRWVVRVYKRAESPPIPDHLMRRLAPYTAHALVLLRELVTDV